MKPKKTRTASAKRKPQRKTPGPKPDVLKIEGDWQDAMNKSLRKKKPAVGWPK